MNLPANDSYAPSLREICARQQEDAQRKASEHWQTRVAEQRSVLAKNQLDSGAYIELAHCLTKLERHEEAIAELDEGLARCPNSERLHEMRLSLLEKCNRTEEAIAAAQNALVIFPNNIWLKMKEALLLPVLYSGDGEVKHYRNRFTAGLSKLAKEISLDSPAAKWEALSALASHVNLGLGYQARDDRALQTRYGELAHRIMAANFPEFSGTIPMPPLGPAGKLRIGYISSRFRDVSATKCFLGWITRHSQSKFDVYAYYSGNKTDAVTEEVKRSVRSFRQLAGPVGKMARTIFDDQLHILIYLDVGMQPILTQLAAMRLAPIQCVTWDQPITSGLPTMDYFISSELMEPEDGNRHYSEELIRLPGVGVCFRKPIIPKMLFAKQRKGFRIKEDAVVYLCCQAAQKQLPSDDDIFVEIAQRVRKAQFIFLTPNTGVARDLQKRLDGAFSSAGLNAGDHIVVLGMLDRFTYWNLNVLADIFLDTMGWSGGVSTIEAIACGLPIVTLPGMLMRSNHSRAILTQLGVTQTIARSKAEYVDIAARLGTDLAWRARIKQAMTERHQAFYADDRCVAALEDFFQRVAMQQ